MCDGSLTAARPSILRNASVLLQAHLASRLLSLVALLVLPRHVDPDELGFYFVAIAVANVLGSFAEFGMRDPLIRELHLRSKDAARTLGVALGIRATFSLGVLGGCWVVVEARGYDTPLATMIWLLAGAEIGNGIARVFHMVFRARERLGYESALVLMERALTLVVGTGLVVAGVGGIKLFCVVALSAGAVNMVVSGSLASGRFVRVAPRFAPSAWRPFLVLCAPYAVANILNYVYLRSDQILLGEWGAGGSEAVAWYGIGYSWVAALSVFPGALMAAAFPRFASLSEAGGSAATRRDLTTLYTQTWKVALAMGLPAAVFIAICGGKLMRALYPMDVYPPGSIDASFRAMALYAGLIFPATIISNSLRAANRWKAVVVLVCVALVVNIAGNAWAMPRYGHVGAAWARGVSELVFVALGAGYSFRRLTRLSEYRFVALLGAACVGLVGALLALEAAPVWIQAPVGALVYAGLLVMLRPVRRSDLNFGAPSRPADATTRDS
jgi:O-antigen/teichoic acid export membrane protein